MDKSKEAEIQRYLTEAKEAVKGSESRELLLEAVENLSKALQEVRSYKIEEIIQRTKAYTKYCIKASKCLNEVKVEAPYASKAVDAVMIEIGIPILDDKIKDLFKEVEEAAKSYCKKSKGTSREAVARSIYKNAVGLSQTKSQIDAELYTRDETVPLLKANINRLPRQSRGNLRIQMKSMRTATLEKKLKIINSVLQAALLQGENDELRLEEYKKILDAIQSMDFSLSKRLSLSSTELGQSLSKLQTDINSLNRKLESEGQSQEKLIQSLKEKDPNELERLENLRKDLLQAIADLAESNKGITKEVQSLRLPEWRDNLSLVSDLYTLASIGLDILSGVALARSYLGI